MLRSFSFVIAAASLALGLSAALPATSFAQDKPARKTAPKKVKKGKKQASARAKKDKPVNVKKSLAHTDTLIGRARKAHKKKNVSGDMLRNAEAHQKAASQAHKQGDTPSSVHLTLEARRLAREVITSNGQKVPKKFSSNLKTETKVASPSKAGSYLASDIATPTSRRNQAPPVDDMNDADPMLDDSDDMNDDF